MHQIHPLRPDGTITISPIGHVRSAIKAEQTGGFTECVAEVVVDQEFEPLLEGLDDFSHVIVVYWMDQIEDFSVRRRPQGRDDVPLIGMLASR